MKVKEIIGEGLIDKAIKGGAALTGINLLTDPESDKFSSAGVGRALAKTGGQIKDFVGGVYRGMTGADKAAPAAPAAPASDSSQPANNQQRSNAPAPAPAPAPPPESAAEPAPPPAADESEDARGRRLGRERLANWPSGQNESVKKKFAVTEADKPSSFELEIEKNFSDPYVRKAILAKARQESGGRNIGEKSYAGNTNDYIRKIFRGNPHLAKLSDAELSALKKNSTAFYDVVYKDLGGSKYRGRGPIQITGKANYARIDKDLGLNGALIKDPDMLLKDPALANAASVQYLKNAGLHKKTFNDQRSAHQGVIYAIGGSLYAPGSERGNRVLADIENPKGKQGTATTLAGKDSGSNSVAKPSAANPADPAKEKLLQMPDYSMGYKRGDKFIPVTDKGPGAPVDYDQAYNQAQRSMGISPAEALRQSDERLAAHRAAHRQTVQQAPVQAPAEPRSVVPKTPEPAKVAEPTLPYAQAYPDQKVAAAQDTGAWDKFINTVTKGRVPPQDKERIQVPESDLNDILRLAGRKNENK